MGITILCVVIFFSYTMLNAQTSVSGQIYLWGNPDLITIQKNIAYKEISENFDYNEAVARNLAFYHYDEIITGFSENNYITQRSERNDPELLKYFVGLRTYEKNIFEEDNDKIFENLQATVSNLLPQKIQYINTNLDLTKVPILHKKYEDLHENLSVIIFIDTAKLEDDIHIHSYSEKIDKEKMIDRIIEEFKEQTIGTKGKISQIFTTKGFNVKSLSQEGLDTTSYCMVKYEGEDWNELQRKAFYASADYYVVVAIDNITLEYFTDPDKYETLNESSWQITEATITFKMRNVAANDEVTFIRIKNRRTYIASNEGNADNQYREPFSDLIYLDIAPQLAMSTQRLGEREEYSEFFPQMYQYLGNKINEGYELKVYLEKTTRFGANDFKKLIEKKLGKDSDFNFDFEVKDFEDYTYTNCFCEQASYVILKNCKFDISDFNGELQSLIEKEYGVSLKKPKSPIFFTLFVATQNDTISECNKVCNWESNRKIVLCPTAKYPEYKYNDKHVFEIENESGDILQISQKRYIDGKIILTLLEEKDNIFKKGHTYSVYFDDKIIQEKYEE